MNLKFSFTYDLKGPFNCGVSEGFFFLNYERKWSEVFFFTGFSLLLFFLYKNNGVF
jgi:hypothetical protein